MNSKLFIAIAALAAVAATTARADEADGSQYGVQFQGTRTRAEVRAEAMTVPANHSQEPAGSRVAAPMKSAVDAKLVRAQAAQALRLGQISHGEVGPL